eukprot:4824046-Prymnesium_polylepis.1
MYVDAPNVRQLLLAHAREPRFVIVDSAAPNASRVDGVQMMLRSTFCWAPPGQRYGDARRHLPAAFLGCIPVFSVPDGHHTLEEALPWARMSLSVSADELPRLPAILRAVEPRQIAAMRRALRAARHALWYSSMYGECRAEMGGALPDAFDTLMAILRSRLQQREVEPGALAQLLNAAAAPTDEPRAAGT